LGNATDPPDVAVISNARHRSFLYRTKVTVARQVAHLSESCHCLEHAQYLLGAEVVIGLHDVIGDERHGRPQRSGFILFGSPQREVR
jgi:hypothetical protein